MVADMQRLDQVLRELQPVLKTLNDKSNALVFLAKDKKIHSRRERNNEKWLIWRQAYARDGAAAAAKAKRTTSCRWRRAARKAPPPEQSLLWVSRSASRIIWRATGGLSDHRRAVCDRQ